MTSSSASRSWCRRAWTSSTRRGSFNFCTIIFYETGYDLNLFRQAAARHWRIGQKKDCRTYYLYYEGTMQERAMALMGKKLAAAQALEGKFSTEGLIAMAGEENGAMALAATLSSKVENAERQWARIGEASKVVIGDLVKAGKVDRIKELAGMGDDEKAHAALVLKTLTTRGTARRRRGRRRASRWRRCTWP